MLRRSVVPLCFCGILWAEGVQLAWGQNDWQFPDPYFGAVEFDIARSSSTPNRRVVIDPSAPRTKPVRPRALRSPHRLRGRGSPAGPRP